MDKTRDHGGRLDAAIARYGRSRRDWLDLSTGINQKPYSSAPPLPFDADIALPDLIAQNRLINAARRFWNVPKGAEILATPGASIAIAQIPYLARKGRVRIDTPTYNEHAAAFEGAGWAIGDGGDALVAVHPNNPDGRLWDAPKLQAPLTVIDESFCDVMPAASHIALAARPGTLILKGLGKFWGLAGVRLGFVIGDPALVDRLRQRIGPWAVSGQALHYGAHALEDHDWAASTRTRLAEDARALDKAINAPCIGGITLFRLYDVNNAALWQDRLARHQIWSRTFPYNPRWLRLGVPTGEGLTRLQAALQ